MQPAYSNDILRNINEFTLIKKYLSDIGTSYASHISTNVGVLVENPRFLQIQGAQDGPKSEHVGPESFDGAPEIDFEIRL